MGVTPRRAWPLWVRLTLGGVTDRRRALASVRIPLVAAVVIPAALVLVTANNRPEYRASPGSVLLLLDVSLPALGK